MRYLLFIFTLVFSLPGYSQPVTPTADLDYIIEEFTLPGGRTGNNVNAIVQGPYGFMWFGSHGGLHRYDGHEFVTYKNVPGDTIGETTSLTFPYIENLYWDKSNMLWVTTYGGGLYRFDPVNETFKHFAHNPEDSTSISHQRVLCAVEDAQGQLWFGTENGLNRYDRKTGKFKRYYAHATKQGALFDDDVRKLYVDKQGTLWIGTGFVLYGTNLGALSRYNPDTDSFTSYRYNPDGTSSVRGLLEDSRGNFWVGTSNGLYKMDRQAGTFERMTEKPAQPFAPGTKDRQNPAVYTIHEDQKGGMWIGTIGEYSYPTHLLRYDTTLKKSQVFPVQSSAWNLCESSDGTIWLAGAGDTGKVLKIKPKSKTYDLYTGGFFQLEFNKSPLAKELTGMVFGPSDMALHPVTGHYWFQLAVLNKNRWRALVADYDPKSGETSFHHLPKQYFEWGGQNNIGIKGMVIDKRGTIWGSYPAPGGIFNFDPITQTIKQYLHDDSDSTSLASNHVVTLMMDSRGDIWVSLFDNGVNRLNPTTGKITHYHFNTAGFGYSDEAAALMEDREGKIWVAGRLGYEGYSMFAIIDPKTDAINKLIMPDFGMLRYITTMAQSPRTGEVVFTIYGNGIGTYDPVNEIFGYQGTNNGFQFDNAAGVVCDKEGVFWIADTDSQTFVRIDGQSDFVFQESSPYGIAWRNGLLGPNGHVYFISLGDGWVEIDPSSIRPEVSSDASKAMLIDFYMLGEKQKPNNNAVLSKPLWMVTEISVPSNAQNFGFRFSDFDFQNTNPQFQYRLYPYETEWKKSGYSPTANYYNVPTGTYNFQVQSLGQGGSGARITELQVIVLPPWWNTWWAYGAYGLMFIGSVFTVDRVQRKRLLAKAHADAREKELKQAREIEKAYTELKATQAQLIQSEKMASLGELTAGIAHEIQNPLNFVNNFSEVNSELIAEMNEELLKGNIDAAKTIAKDIDENEKKIIFHGKRADGIVKGMLQHSRASSGQKELTDINVLADEYLRLAYHGLRAKDKTFNAKFETDFDTTLEKVNVIPQDMGRVILNLITNAFYAVNEKSKQNLPGYEPTVTVSTIRSLSSGEGRGEVLIKVTDNGNGIPQHLVDKIFQPFFTTKPTGQGTGLGLSLSYDIVKAHGGELKVVTKEGEGSEFMIKLPIV